MELLDELPGGAGTGVGTGNAGAGAGAGGGAIEGVPPVDAPP